MTTEKEQKLLERLEKLGIREEDIKERFIRGSGSGGQKINKTSNCVYLQHEPSGIEIKCQRTRSQALNRYYARVQLCEEFEERVLGVQSKRQQEAEKIRRQKRRRSRRQKEKILGEKRQRSQVKELRKPPDPRD